MPLKFYQKKKGKITSVFAEWLINFGFLNESAVSGVEPNMPRVSFAAKHAICASVAILILMRVSIQNKKTHRGATTTTKTTLQIPVFHFTNTPNVMRRIKFFKVYFRA